jgi:phosphoribosylformylglycinamidine synthase
VSRSAQQRQPTPGEPAITPDLIAAHGLTRAEYNRILDLVGREPTLTELGIFSAMWNEHCSYKSSKKWLRTLPTSGPRVIQGPGENAGVVDIGDGQVVVFKMESHNHPSFIEPYQGAATGVGGILRDVFTMGARPIAALNALRFGAPDHAKTRHLVSGVVAGIGGYGNAFGVPTVGGEINFHARYNGNILVNAFAAGIADVDRIFYSKAEGIGLPVVYLGSKTGRDGIHGASMASAEFDNASHEKRPTVQVGDPFSEKLLLEACLELMASGAVVAIQDMGAAGLTCSAVEMGAKGDLGIELDLDRVPCREDGMTAYEMMLSESQERMLMVLRPDMHDVAEAIFRKWGLDFAIIGRTTVDKRFRIFRHGEMEADLPIKELGDQAPEYDRRWTPRAKPLAVDPASIHEPGNYTETLLYILGSPDMCSRRYVWEQYDHVILGNTLQKPGGDAAVVRIGGTQKALAFSVDATPRYCDADPVEGGKQAVAECWRNLTAVGADPLAVTDNLNFGNPERPEIMGELVGCVEGIADACRALEFPVVSGNVSLYNETNGVAIPPTPAIGGVGLLPDHAAMASIALKSDGDVILLVGEPGRHLGRSIYLREILGREEGTPPPVDLAAEKRNGDFVRSVIRSRRVNACHDISDGGLLIALAEMAIAGARGAEIAIPPGTETRLGWLHGEDQARYLLSCRPGNLDAVVAAAKAAKTALSIIGRAGGAELKVSGLMSIPVAKLAEAHEYWFPAFMSGRH